MAMTPLRPAGTGTGQNQTDRSDCPARPPPSHYCAGRLESKAVKGPRRDRHSVIQREKRIGLADRVVPHTATVPSARNAMPCAKSAAMATTLLRPAGTFVWPKLLSPHATAAPDLSASIKVQASPGSYAQPSAARASWSSSGWWRHRDFSRPDSAWAVL